MTNNIDNDFVEELNISPNYRNAMPERKEGEQEIELGKKLKQALEEKAPAPSVNNLEKEKPEMTPFDRLENAVKDFLKDFADKWEQTKGKELHEQGNHNLSRKPTEIPRELKLPDPSVNIPR